MTKPWWACVWFHAPSGREVVVALTRLALVLHRRPLAVSVQGGDSDGVGSVRDQVVQESVAKTSWNQDLFGEETQGSKYKLI